MLIFTGIGKFVKMQVRRQLRMGMSRQNQKEQKPSLVKKLTKGVRFEMKGDKRSLFKKGGPSRTLTYWLIFISGAALSVASSFIGLPFYFIALIISLLSMIYAYMTSKGLLQEQENIKQRLYDTKKSMMGVVGGGRDAVNFDDEFKIMEWADDNTTFNKVMLTIPTTFDQLNSSNVIEKMNQNFGGGTAWVAVGEGDINKWDFVKGKVILQRTAELPHRADWDEHYVLSDDIAWSFFPLGLGVDNGVELVNPKTGEKENVLGFDLQGNEQKLGKKKGFKVGPEIIAAPQVLIAGGTGGGKSLVETTTIPVYEKSDFHEEK